MTEILSVIRPQRVDVDSARTLREPGQRRVHLRLRELAIQAGLGAGSEQLVPPLRDLFQSELAAHSSRPAAERLRIGKAFLHGVCNLARWFDPARSAQAVPPLCVVLWHVGRAFETLDPCTLWMDFVLPHDGRRLAAVDWAHDIRMLLTQAAVPHRAESVVLPPLAMVAQPSLRDVGAWGCMSLWQGYRCSGEVVREALR